MSLIITSGVARSRGHNTESVSSVPDKERDIFQNVMNFKRTESSQQTMDEVLNQKLETTQPPTRTCKTVPTPKHRHMTTNRISGGKDPRIP
jgi:hypothetical protein